MRHGNAGGERKIRFDGLLESREPSQDFGFVSGPKFNAVTGPVTVATANQHDSSGPAVWKFSSRQKVSAQH
jgi:hypothetical protein